jgi:hypothetical protein
LLVGPAVAVVLASAGGSRRGGCWWYQWSMFAGGSGNRCLLVVCWWYQQSQLRPKGGLCAKRATVALPSQAYSAEGGPASPAWDAQRRGGKARRKHRLMEIPIVLYIVFRIFARGSKYIHTNSLFWACPTQLRPKGGLSAKRATVALPSQTYSAEEGPASSGWDAQRLGGKSRRAHRVA